MYRKDSMYVLGTLAFVLGFGSLKYYHKSLFNAQAVEAHIPGLLIFVLCLAFSKYYKKDVYKTVFYVTLFSNALLYVIDEIMLFIIEDQKKDMDPIIKFLLFLINPTASFWFIGLFYIHIVLGITFLYWICDFGYQKYKEIRERKTQ